MTVHLLFLPYYKIVHHFHFLLATTSCKNVETLYRKTRLFLLNITPNHTSVKSNRPPPPPSPVLKELFHQNLKHVLATLRSGGRGGGGSQALLGPRDAL